MSLRFAFAVDQNEDFKKQHFGNADKFLIYEMSDNTLIKISERKNIYKTEEHEGHGLRKKGNAIIKLLKESNVQVLVSTMFGKNINIINEHFIPVRVSLSPTDEIVNVLIKHMHWIRDEWESRSSGYMLFTIRSGIMKTSID